MKKLNIIIASVLFLYGCDMVKLYNSGPYTGDIKRARKAYYDKETPAQKALREENDIFCTRLAELPENRAKGGQKMDLILRDCMEERGSPLF